MNGERSTRRGVLAAAGGLLLGAGCLDQSVGGSDSDPAELGTRTPTPEPVAGDVRGSVRQVYQETVGSVVLIRTTGPVGQRQQGGQGSGFVYDERHVITNEHVVAGASDVTLQFKNGAYREGTVVGTDPYTDLAVVRVDSVPDIATPLALAERDPPVGTRVVAIGNPFGLEASASAGVVSGLNRTIPRTNAERNADFEIPDVIQTDAAVNPGNSGGPLVRLDGTVAAVISAGITSSDNIGFGISAPLAGRVVPALIADGQYDHSLMGVRLQPVTPTVAQANNLDAARGVVVVEVIDGGPSDGALQPSDESRVVDGQEVAVGGDVIVAMDGQPIPSMNALSSYLALQTSPGDDLTVTVLRDGERRQVTVTLGRRQRL
jgi:S1-C subfamily serine protease